MIETVIKFHNKRTCPKCGTKHIFDYQDVNWTHEDEYIKNPKVNNTIVHLLYGYIVCLNCNHHISIKRQLSVNPNAPKVVTARKTRKK